MPFDPDAYLTKKGSAAKFDPDAYLAKPEVTPPEGMMKRMTRGTLGALPYAGGTIGSVLGIPGGPGGMVVGAGTGAFVGTAIKQAGEGLLDGKVAMPTARGLVGSFKEPLDNAAIGMASELVPVAGVGAGKMAGRLAEKISGKAPVLSNELQFTKHGWFAPSSGAEKVAEKSIAPAAEEAAPGLISKLGEYGARAGVGGYVGKEVSNELGIDPKVGMYIGALASNPAALKVIMQQARSGNAAAMKALSDPTIQAAIKQGSGQMAKGLLNGDK